MHGSTGAQNLEIEAGPFLTRPEQLWEIRLSNLGQADLFGLQTLRAAGHDKGDLRTFVERTVATRLDCGKMDEDIFAVFALNKSETFSGVKPLYGSCFFHVFLCFSFLAWEIQGNRLRRLARKRRFVEVQTMLLGFLRLS